MNLRPVRDILSQPAPQALTDFMERWHGLTPASHEVPSEQPLPAALRRFYAAYGAAPDGVLINHLQAPEDIYEADDAAFSVFYAEEQFAYVWAIANDDLEAEDPPVWGRENESGKRWLQESRSVSLFLVQALVMSAALASPHGAAAAWLAPDEAERVLEPLELLDLPPWHWPGHPARWYAGSDVVAFTAPNRSPDDAGEPHMSVWIGSLSDESVQFVEPHLSENWEYFSPRDL
jgi:hypothetical protein